MSANKTNLELLLEIYAGVKDGQFDLSHDPKDKWRIAIVQLWKNSYERVIAHGVGGTVEDAKKEGSFLDRCDCMPRRNDKTTIQKAFKLDWCHIHSHRFANLWQSIYNNWESNPWVWVYEFSRINP